MSKKTDRDYLEDGFVLKEKLGSGSFSTVHKAFDKVRKSDVAIKCINKSAITREKADNIIREIEILKMMHHPHVVDMLDFHWDDKYVYIVLEFCDGGDLSKYIKRNQKIPESICKTFMKQLIDGLKYLRSKDIYHYDLKPQNILIKMHPKLTLKISDFGLALLANPKLDIKPGFGPRGTPLYMAPEMLLCDTYDPSLIDLWSLGVILYECLHGKLPLPYKNVEDLVKAMKAWKPIVVDKSLSSNCKSLLQLLLSYDPKRRITFDQLMIHPFLNFEYHPPSEETYRKAIKTERKAVKLDFDEEYHRAFYKYCESFKYLVPFVTEGNDESRRIKVLKKMQECVRRIEELTAILYSAKLHYSMIARDYKEKSKKRRWLRRKKRLLRKKKKLQEKLSDFNLSWKKKFEDTIQNPLVNLQPTDFSETKKEHNKNMYEDEDSDDEDESDEREKSEESLQGMGDEGEEESDMVLWEGRYERIKKERKTGDQVDAVEAIESEAEEVLSQPDRMDSEPSSFTDEQNIHARNYRSPSHLTTDQVAALKTMSRPTPKMYDGLDVGYAAQMYLYEGNYVEALDKFMISLSILIPLLRKEGPGRRRSLLTIQVKEFLNLAESVKTLLSVNDEIQNARLKPKDPGPSVEEFCRIH
ncbi:hypothetical protein O3M35_007348 [Rhynocoris fuscipes]|uniref:Serine/threonine-protein kinase ULK3 n=1 Tax=Rhynocoris fuscipes TaxID=488301 RepID=A0AAW1DEU4_9HEMI